MAYPESGSGEKIAPHNPRVWESYSCTQDLSERSVIYYRWR